jgi:hypothetical protein
MGSIAGSMTGDGISEIEEEKDGEDKSGNIIMVSSIQVKLYSRFPCDLVG